MKNSLDGIISTSDDLQGRLKRLCLPRLVGRFNTVAKEIIKDEEHPKPADPWFTIADSPNQLVVQNPSVSSDDAVQSYVEKIIQSHAGIIITICSTTIKCL